MTVPEFPSEASTTVSQGWSYVDEGEGPTVVAIHGLPGSVRDFRWLAPPCVDVGLRLIRVDSPGFGGSRACGPSPPEIAEAFVEFLDQFAYSPVYLICHSFGSVYAAEIAARWPSRVLGVIWVSPVGMRIHRGFKAFPSMKLLYAGMQFPPTRRPFMKALSEGLEKSGFKDTSPQEVRRLVDCLSHWKWERHRENLGLISSPNLCVWSSDDPLIENEIIEEMAEFLGAQTVRFDKGAHNPQKFQAVEIAQAVREFVEATAPQFRVRPEP